MAFDSTTIRRIARLSRIALDDEQTERMTGELNRILGFVQHLQEIDVSGVPPLTFTVGMSMKKRPDIVNEGNIAADILQNAPACDGNFFLVPKTLE